MCIIVDANIANLVFRENPPSEFRPARDWLDRPGKDGCVVLGGRLSVELQHAAKTRRYLAGLSRAGRAMIIPTRVVQAEEEVVRQTGLCVSDDCHVVALARTSGARTLLSGDHHLHIDFKNRQLISKPKGSVYQKASHAPLLKHTSSCGRL